MMEYVRADPSRFSVSDVGGVASFEELLVRVDHSVLCGTIFQGCIEQVRGLSWHRPTFVVRIFFGGGVARSLGGVSIQSFNSVG